MGNAGNSRISLIGRVLSSKYGSTLANSGVKQLEIVSGHGLISSLIDPGMYLYFFIMDAGRFSSGKNLYKSSSFIFSDSFEMIAKKMNVAISHYVNATYFNLFYYLFEEAGNGNSNWSEVFNIIGKVIR